MKVRSLVPTCSLALACSAPLLAVATLAGCAVSRGQESAGAYIDDAAITSSIKARYVNNPDVDATAISVETLNGAVILSGFAKSGSERDAAERIAREVKGVQSVKNSIVVRP